MLHLGSQQPAPLAMVHLGEVSVLVDGQAVGNGDSVGRIVGPLQRAGKDGGQFDGAQTTPQQLGLPLAQLGELGVYAALITPRGVPGAFAMAG